MKQTYITCPQDKGWLAAKSQKLQVAPGRASKQNPGCCRHPQAGPVSELPDAAGILPGPRGPTTVSACTLPLQVGCLEELARLQAAAGDAAQRPDWTHIFCSVLPSLPLPPASSAAGAGLGRQGDVRVTTALRTAVARLVANHINAFRQVGRWGAASLSLACERGLELVASLLLLCKRGLGLVCQFAKPHQCLLLTEVRGLEASPINACHKPVS